MENGGFGVQMPKMMIYSDTDQSDVKSELDLDLYDTDEVIDITNKRTTTVASDNATAHASSFTATSQSSFVGKYNPSYASTSSSSFAGARPNLDGAETASNASSAQRRRQLNNLETTSSNSSQFRRGRGPFQPNSFIRTDFTTQQDVGTPVDDTYEALCTPPGEPPSSQPGEAPDGGFVPANIPRTMRPLWILVAIIASIAIGVVLNTVHLSSQVGYWIDVVGQLYRRSVNCITLPLAFCQVVVASSSLTSSSSLKKLWIRVGLIFALVVVVSSSIGIILMEVMRPMMRDNTKDLGLKASHPPFAFKCPNAKFLEQRDNGTLTCTGDSVQPNTTFPWMVDKSLALGLDEPIPSVNISQYLFSLLDMYFPDNIFVSFAKDLSLSVCVVAMALGVAITRSFHGAQRRGNPLLRLFLHIYSSLATMLEWVQSIALIATFPLIIGAIVKTTDLSKLLQQTQYFCLGFVISLLIQGLVIMPAIFFLFTRRNPYSWLKEVMAPALYGFVLMNPLLPLNMATKTVLRTKEVSSPVFGAVYPVLASLNRISFALALPNAVVFAAAFTECEANMDPADVMLLYAMSIVASFGDTALSKSQWAFFMTTWRTFCPGIDIPTAMIALQNTWLLTSRLTAFFDSMTNLMIVRMVSNVVNPPEAPAQRSALHTAQPI